MQNEEAACLGAAMLAGVATGIYPNLKEATEKMVRVKNRIEPQKGNAVVYKKDYQCYLDLYNSLLGIFKKE